MSYNALHNTCPTFQKGEEKTYKELKTECFTFRNWIAKEKRTILELNREIAAHLEYLDMYENRLKLIEEDIIRYEIKQELEEGEQNENN